MEKTLLIIGLLMLFLNTYAKEIKGKVVDWETGKGLNEVFVKIQGFETSCTCDSSGQFSLKYETSDDSISIRIFSITYSDLIVENIPTAHPVDLRKINLIKIPSEIEVSYHGISKLRNLIYQCQDKRRYRKEKRRFPFTDIWIDQPVHGYWMKATQEEYVYSVYYLDLKSKHKLPEMKEARIYVDF